MYADMGFKSLFFLLLSSLPSLLLLLLQFIFLFARARENLRPCMRVRACVCVVCTRACVRARVLRCVCGMLLPPPPPATAAAAAAGVKAVVLHHGQEAARQFSNHACVRAHVCVV